MKNTLYFLALSVSLILTACSSDEQEGLPLAPQVEKVIVNDVNLSYAYLQSFEEINNAKISIHSEKDGVILVINTGSQRVDHMFAVIEQHGAPMMVFLGSSAAQKYFIKGLSTSRSLAVRIYGGSRDDLQVAGTAPFSPSTVFNNIPVKGWAASEPYIKVSSTKFPAGLINLFTELKTKKGNLLVYLSRPAEEDFEIPRYGDLGIADLKLFGNSAYRLGESD